MYTWLYKLVCQCPFVGGQYAVFSVHNIIYCTTVHTLESWSSPKPQMDIRMHNNYDNALRKAKLFFYMSHVTLQTLECKESYALYTEYCTQHTSQTSKPVECLCLTQLDYTSYIVLNTFHFAVQAIQSYLLITLIF